MAILVFPSCLEPAVSFAQEARRWGQRVVGASSLSSDPYASHYDAWEPLPYIGERDFFDALGALAARHEVQSIFTPHAASFNLLKKELPGRLPNVSIIGEGPFKAQIRKVEETLAQATHDLASIADFGPRNFPYPVQFIAGLLRQMDLFYGQCSREKALGICAMMSAAVKGDVIEIGSMFGKSAYLLNRVASYLSVGATLVVDPWDLASSIQYEAPLNIQDAPRNWNWEMMHQGFLVNMLGCASPPFNYMRAKSADAYIRYCAKPAVESPEFGTTVFAGSISVLHIDGNHDEASVANDFDLWSKRLALGAWIVFDDYEWSHGDGPRKVADRVVREYGPKVRRRFTAGGALFMNLGREVYEPGH
jgi:hypothetical protein